MEAIVKSKSNGVKKGLNLLIFDLFQYRNKG